MSEIETARTAAREADDTATFLEQIYRDHYARLTPYGQEVLASAAQRARQREQELTVELGATVDKIRATAR